MRIRFKEPISGFSHLVGGLLGMGGLVYLLLHSSSRAEAIAVGVFGLSLVLLYFSSAVYHLSVVSQRMSLILRKIDHSMIFVLIAGSYTPFCVVALEGLMGRALLITIWTLALGGSLFKIRWIHAPRWVSTGIYLGMGWLSLAFISPLTHYLGFQGTLWLIMGGIFYTVGAVIHSLEKPNPFPPHFGSHEIWHFMVLAGSFSHFLCIATFL